jgi:hypothetical protein
MATKNFQARTSHNWDDSPNWVGGLPQPGDTAVISGTYAGVNALTLDDINVQLSDGELFANNLALSDSEIIDTGDIAFSWIQATSLALDKISFIGDDQNNSSLYVESYQGTNNGRILAEASGARVIVEGKSPLIGAFANNGQLVATNGGTLTLFAIDVTGNGLISVSNGGKLELPFAATIGSNQFVDLGGQASTTLAYNPIPPKGPIPFPPSSLAASIHDFGPTDTIDIQNFAPGTAEVYPLGTTNPTLAVINPIAPYFGGPFIETISLSGNYANYYFTATPDAAGTGTDITVHPLT